MEIIDKGVGVAQIKMPRSYPRYQFFVRANDLQVDSSDLISVGHSDGFKYPGFAQAGFSSDELDFALLFFTVVG